MPCLPPQIDPFPKGPALRIAWRVRRAAYLRYVYDFLLFARHKRTLWGWRKAIVERLGSIRLTVHSGWRPRPVTEGIPFLGFVVYPERRRLKRRKGIQYRRRLKRAVQRYCEGELGAEVVLDSVRGWENHARYGNTVGLRRAVLECAHGVPGIAEQERRCHLT